MFRFLIRQSATLAFIEALALLFAISWLDLATGHQVSLVLFYTAPIVFAVWLCDNKSVFVIAGLAGVLWSWADLAMGNSYSNETVQACELAIRFAFFFLVGLAGIAMREQQRASNARISLLEHTQRLEKQIIEVSEYEQQRIGRDLHDGLCQFLAAIGCAATSLKIDLKEQRLDKLAANASEIEKLLSESVKQARDLSHGLVPVQLNEAGLPAALQELAAATSRLLPVECTFESAGQNGASQNGKATHLYRIAQEAIHNATQHGKARKIDIRLSANASATSLSIADDGIGFPRNGNETNGVGVSIMRYRANLMDGEFAIEAGVNGGTIVSCTVPTGAER
ncbi:MAG TPA: sensor histidine kinase [Chthoniobacterales bacterium]|nr:sensor histidine kinase [Chthoniobacterales bacterium]